MNPGSEADRRTLSGPRYGEARGKVDDAITGTPPLATIGMIVAGFPSISFHHFRFSSTNAALINRLAVFRYPNLMKDVGLPVLWTLA